MKYIYFITTLLFCFACSFSGYSNEVISFEPVLPEGGLPSNEIRKMYQDKEGYFWVSTYGGLARYDGYNFVLYKTVDFPQKHLINSYINVVVEDENNNLWIATQNGLYILDKVSGLITKNDFPILNNCRVEDILPARNGDVWIATNRGLFYWEKATRDIQYCVGAGWNLDPTDMKTLLEDKEGYLWIGTWSSSLLRYDIEKREAHRCSYIPSLNSSHTLFQDRSGNVWIGTWGGGLIKLVNPYAEDFVSCVEYTHDPTNDSSLADNIVYTISQDPNTGKIWVGSRTGLSILNNPLNRNSFTNYTTEDEKYTLPFNEVNSIIATRDNMMWIGMLGGGIYYANTGQIFLKNDPLESIRRELGTSSVKCIFSNEKDKYWISIAGFGLVYYDQNTGKFKKHTEIPAFQNKNYISAVNAITYRERTGEICYATWDDGVWIYNKQKNNVRVINMDANEKFEDDCVYSFYEDSNTDFWIGTRSGIGILMGNDDVYVPLNDLLAPGQPKLHVGYVFSIVEDKDKNIWIATNNDGIYKVQNSDKGKLITPYDPQSSRLPTEGILSLYIDHLNRLWVGTETGLMLYDSEKDKFAPFGSGVRLYGNVVNNIVEDENHHLWLTTNGNITELLIDYNNQAIYSRSYTKDDGLLDNYFNRNSNFKTSDGSILFGGYRGINSIPTGNIPELTDNSSVVITDFKIFNKSLADYGLDERKKISKATIGFTDKVVLPYNKNNFNIDFSLLNYTNSSKNRYAYKLIGYDEDWVQTDAKRHFAYYNNLKSGVYTFQVRGANSNDIWSSDLSTLQIEILPPPWFTWWAYCIYILLIALGAYITYRVVSNRIKMERAIEIGEMNRKNIEEVNHAKLQFFTNITHELLTPLSIITAAVEQLKISNPNKREYGLITNNATRLMRLIQQVLEFRKAESGNLKLKVSKGDISLFVENCVNAFLPLAKKQKLNFTFSSEPENIVGFFDPDKCDKIVYNLLSNAAKYNKESGEVCVAIALNKEKSHVIIRVKDTGAGMTPEELKNIFKRFYEGDYRKHHTIGTGIGLSLVKNLVDIHYGTIEVESKKDEGTCFTITIPILESYYTKEEVDKEILINSESFFSIEDESDFIDDTTDEKVSDTENLLKLLLIEDNEELRELLKRYFHTTYNVFTAENAEDAIGILEKEDSIGLIISDVMMPGMNGYEFCSYVKNKFEYCHIPVVLITAKQTTDAAIAGYESDADSYITKPLNLAVLEAKIKNLIKKQQRAGVDFRKQLVFEAKELNYTSMDEKFIQQAIDCVNNHLDNSEFDQSTFVREMNTSRTTLTDKLKTLTGLTPSAFINNIRLNAACRILEEKGKVRVSDLAFAVGFNDSKYFSTLFKKKFGVSPLDYVKNKNQVSE